MLILPSNIYYEQKRLCFQTSSKHKKVVYKINVYLYECCCLCVNPNLVQNLLDRFYTKLYCLCSARKDTVFCYTQNQTLFWQQASFLQKFGVYMSRPFYTFKSHPRQKIFVDLRMKISALIFGTDLSAANALVNNMCATDAISTLCVYSVESIP